MSLCAKAFGRHALPTLLALFAAETILSSATAKQPIENEILQSKAVTCATHVRGSLDELILLCQSEITALQQSNASMLYSTKGYKDLSARIKQNNRQVYQDKETIYGAKRLKGDVTAMPPVLSRQFSRRRQSRILSKPTTTGTNWTGQEVTPGVSYCEDMYLTINSVVSTIPVPGNLKPISGQTSATNDDNFRTYLWGGMGGDSNVYNKDPNEALIQNGIAADIACVQGKPVVTFFGRYEDVPDQDVQPIPASNLLISPGDTVVTTTQLNSNYPTSVLYTFKDATQTYVTPYTSPNASQYAGQSDGEIIIERACGDLCEPASQPKSGTFTIKGTWSGSVNSVNLPDWGINQAYDNKPVCAYDINDTGECLSHTEQDDTPNNCDAATASTSGNEQVMAAISPITPSGAPNRSNPSPQ